MSATGAPRLPARDNWRVIAPISAFLFLLTLTAPLFIRVGDPPVWAGYAAAVAGLAAGTVMVGRWFARKGVASLAVSTDPAKSEAAVRRTRRFTPLMIGLYLIVRATHPEAQGPLIAAGAAFFASRTAGRAYALRRYPPTPGTPAGAWAARTIGRSTTARGRSP